MRFEKALTLFGAATLAVGLLSGPLLAGSNDLGGRVSLTLAGDTRIGGTLVPAGRYQVQHVEEADGHYLVFRSGRHEVARQRCELRSLAEKVRTTAVYSEAASDGANVLTAVQLKGQRVSHLLK